MYGYHCNFPCNKVVSDPILKLLQSWNKVTAILLQVNPCLVKLIFGQISNIPAFVTEICTSCRSYVQQDDPIIANAVISIQLYRLAKFTVTHFLFELVLTDEYHWEMPSFYMTSYANWLWFYYMTSLYCVNLGSCIDYYSLNCSSSSIFVCALIVAFLFAFRPRNHPTSNKQ